MSITKLTTNGIVGAKYDTVSADNYYMEPIATTLLSGTSGTITFSNIPQNYKHLQLRAIAQTNRSGYVVDLTKVQFNSDTGANYSSHNLFGGYNTTPNVTANANVSSNHMQFNGLNSGVATSVFTATVMDILDYSNVYKYKTVRNLQGFDSNGTVGTGSLGGTIALSSGLWMNTAAVTSMSISMIDGTAFNTNSRFSLYGIRG
jgi:hypothetical protein